MPIDSLKPQHHLESLSGYHVSEAVEREFPSRVFRPVELWLGESRMICRCGRTQWSMARDGQAFLCECLRCGSIVSFGPHCLSLLDLRPVDGPEIIDIIDAARVIMSD